MHEQHFRETSLAVFTLSNRCKVVLSSNFDNRWTIRALKLAEVRVVKETSRERKILSMDNVWLFE